jgi:hypothetical protein
MEKITKKTKKSRRKLDFLWTEWYNATILSSEEERRSSPTLR